MSVFHLGLGPRLEKMIVYIKFEVVDARLKRLKLYAVCGVSSQFGILLHRGKGS